MLPLALALAVTLWQTPVPASDLRAEARFEDTGTEPAAPYVRNQNAADALTYEVDVELCPSCNGNPACTCTNKVLETKCSLVLVDGCTGRMALHCSTTERGAKKPRAFADEMTVVSPL